MNIQRKIYKKLEKHLAKKEFSIVIGPRQVGKTTLLRQLYEKLKSEEKTVAFLSFEDPDVLHQVNEHPENIFRFAPQPKSGKKVFLFIDEVQYAANPSKLLKYLFDTYAPQLKVIATGSSAFYIDQKFTDSLAGRKIIFEMYSLDFEEFLLFKGKENLIKELHLIKNQKEYLSKKYKEFEFLLEEYMTYGSYPAVILEQSVEYKIVLLKEIKNSFLKKDILESAIEHEEKFYRLLSLLASQIGNTLNSNELAGTLKLNEKTLSRYLFVLQKCFHIQLLKPFYQNVRKELTKMPKVYFNDLGLRNVLLNQFENPTNRLDKGQLLENLMYLFLRDKEGLENLRYWRTADGNEVDFVVESSYQSGYAIEVKWNDDKINPVKYKKFTEAYPSFPLRYCCFKAEKIENYILKFDVGKFTGEKTF
jgi:predicted AAA+ superfamily ATPase